MEPMTPTDDGSEAEAHYRDAIADLVNELLDTYYEKHPTANAFGTDYESPNSTDGTFYIGRENGAEGAEDEVGFDYFYRRFPDPENRRSEDTEYIYGRYGWCDANQFTSDRHLLGQLFESAVEDGYLAEESLERFSEAADTLERDMRGVRDEYDLGDLASLIRNHEIDTLRTLLGHGDEESRTIWQLLFSKDESGDHIENPVTVPVISEVDQLMFVRTDRFYYDEYDKEGEWYAYGAVIGYDDTPERFFVHRLSSDPDLRDEDTNWDIDLVKQKMGFDDNLHEVGENMPTERRVRVQGDLALVRHEYADELADRVEYKREVIYNSFTADHRDAFLEEHPEIEDTPHVKMRSYRNRIRITAHDTEPLKEVVQEGVGIEEESVRDEQERRGISRLSAKRRNEIITDLLDEKMSRWCAEHAGKSHDEIREKATEQAQDEFEDVNNQVNEVLGNHTLMMANARDYPDPRYGDDDTEGTFVVPDEATLFIIHDEHDDKQLTLDSGVYEFRFLQGYEDQAWM